jgi:hypothetical protein
MGPRLLTNGSVLVFSLQMTDQSVRFVLIYLRMEGVIDKMCSESVARVARMYKQNKDASAALGISLRYFARLCRQYQIETPYARHRRRIHEAKR